MSMSSNRGMRKLWRLSTAGALAALGASCQNAKNEAAPPARASVSSTVQEGEPPQPEAAPLDRIDEANFQLVWTLGAGDGKSGRGELVLVAKPPFKPNLEYPHKFRLKGSDVTLANTEVTKGEMQVSLERVVVPVSFVVTGPSPVLEGTLAFSVCTAEACLIERKDIRLSVTGPGAPNNAAAAAVGGVPTATAATAAGK